jgi:hypothetical protein
MRCSVPFLQAPAEMEWTCSLAAAHFAAGGITDTISGIGPAPDCAGAR